MRSEVMAEKKVTPLQPKEFFTGKWKGEGELSPHPLLRWLMPKEQIRFLSQAIWLSDTIWMVKERFEFSSRNVISRTMFVEIVGPDRLHVTADDIPLGADIILHEKGFRFTPYYIWSHYRGKRWRLRCIDENLIDEGGIIHDTIRMFYFGFPVATMRLTVDRVTA
jgi:hypothetical protein